MTQQATRRRERAARAACASRRLCGAALALVLLGAPPTQPAAHPGHDGGIYVALVGVEEAPTGAPTGVVALRILVVNETPGTATLRGLSAPGAGAIPIGRRRSLLGLELIQSVGFLQLDRGERVLLAPPDYAVTAEGLDIGAVIRGEVVILADFGPLGTLPLEVVGAPQTTE